LRDPSSGPTRRASTSRSSRYEKEQERTILAGTKKRNSHTPDPPDVTSPTRSQRRRGSTSRTSEVKSEVHQAVNGISASNGDENPIALDRRAHHHSPFYPPLTISGQPVLVEAASRRESAVVETDASRHKIAIASPSRYIAREKTRSSSSLGMVAPFGMPLPSVVEYKSEVCRRSHCSRHIMELRMSVLVHLERRGGFLANHNRPRSTSKSSPSIKSPRPDSSTDYDPSEQRKSARDGRRESCWGVLVLASCSCGVATYASDLTRSFRWMRMRLELLVR